MRGVNQGAQRSARQRVVELEPAIEVIVRDAFLDFDGTGDDTLFKPFDDSAETKEIGGRRFEGVAVPHQMSCFDGANVSLGGVRLHGALK